MTALFDKFLNRTLSVESAIIPELSGEPALAAISITGTEGVDSVFDYQVVLKTSDALNHLISETANFDTEGWRGREMQSYLLIVLLEVPITDFKNGNENMNGIFSLIRRRFVMTLFCVGLLALGGCASEAGMAPAGSIAMTLSSVAHYGKGIGIPEFYVNGQWGGIVEDGREAAAGYAV
jgi:hypothetical protein